ncbi:MAG: polysaccharide deacetylase family protein [Planctomycetota bacterium]
MKRALVSIHDVMPSTMGGVTELIERCRSNGIDKITLLVVPGLDWNDEDLDQLHAWTSEGLRLAGHGWTHHCESIRGLYHRLHSLILSRDVAEHLCLTEAGVLELLRDCGEWFPSQGFESPTLYVPPAWAMGRVTTPALSEAPFAIFETFSGVLSPRNSRYTRCPMVGFEADTLFRKTCVSAFNRYSIARANDSDRPLRIGIHPRDHRLLLSHDLNRILAMGWETMWYDELVGACGVG